MAKTMMWMIRAGEGGYLFEDFQQNNLVAIGWNKLGDLTALDSLELIRSQYSKGYPDLNRSRSSNAIAMIYKFRIQIKIGHLVVTYDPEQRVYLIGSIKSDYTYLPDRKYPHVRFVEWTATISRDSLSTSSRNSLGSTLTLFQINEETINDLIKPTNQSNNEVDEAEEKVELVQLKEDTVSRAHELIKDCVLRLNDEELQQLVAAILRAMGYKTRVSPKGPDRGLDVFASPDGLGLEEPRIKTEVKHRPKSPMGSQEIRSFLGGLRQGDRALYVSTGGFSKDAKYEADRSNIPLMLLTLDDISSLITTHYESFDVDGRVLIPLTRLYWPTD